MITSLIYKLETKFCNFVVSLQDPINGCNFFVVECFINKQFYAIGNLYETVDNPTEHFIDDNGRSFILKLSYIHEVQTGYCIVHVEKLSKKCFNC